MDSFTRPAPITRERERLRDVIIEAIKIAREYSRKCQLDPSPISVQVDVSEGIMIPMCRHLILMAVVNLIKNAYESFAVANEELRAGEIFIRADCHQDLATIVIVDNGIGMANDELCEVESLRPGRRNKLKRYSTGFGLPIAAWNNEGGFRKVHLRSNVLQPIVTRVTFEDTNRSGIAEKWTICKCVDLPDGDTLR